MRLTVNPIYSHFFAAQVPCAIVSESYERYNLKVSLAVILISSSVSEIIKKKKKQNE